MTDVTETNANRAALDQAVARWNAGDYEGYGPLDGHEPTGRSFRVVGRTLMRFRNDVVVERWAGPARPSLLAQLGRVRTVVPLSLVHKAGIRSRGFRPRRNP